MDSSTAQRFATFHEENPAVYAALVRLAREWVAKTGRRKLGIKTLFERTRWEIAMVTTDPDFTLNNNFTAYYARLIMIREPDLADMFNLRRSAADQQIARAS
ncbi:hypothetical protein H7J73_32385 [Mycolicibacterium komossense]|uniref:Uncharacterized protein n=1 Tax=Mycolicibacterium komossense TaxID=1779 RepID=A0ABT3CMN6_9MYCO|nr:hypothetical protein [Mycolicibacterium komossense]